MAQKKITGDQVAVNLTDLQDVDVSGAVDGEVLKRVAGEWASAPEGGAAAPSTEIVFGNATNDGVTSSDMLTFDPATGAFYVNQTSAPLPNGEAYIYSGSNNASEGQAGLELQNPGATGSAGVFMFAGDGEWGGAMEIAAGSGTTSDGGSVSIFSGDGAGSGEILIRTGIADDGNSGSIFLRVQNGSDAGGMVQLQAGNSSGGPGGQIDILAGNSDNNPGIDEGGSIFITAGNTLSATTGVGGDVVIKAGRNLITPANSGSVTLNTGNVDRLSIDEAGAFLVGADAGASGEVLTSQGVGAPPVWAPAGGGGGGVEMNVYYLSGGNGFFSGFVNNWSTVSQRDESPTTLWGNFDSYTGSFECLEGGIYEIVTECNIYGDAGAPSYVWPDGYSAYGVDMPVDTPALMDMPQTKAHTRYSPEASFPNLNGNFGLSQLSPPAGEAGTRVMFTERYIVRSAVGGLVYPRLFAAHYNSSGSAMSCSMTISFMRVGDYSPE